MEPLSIRTYPLKGSPMASAETLRIEVDGMSCAGCAGRAERALDRRARRARRVGEFCRRNRPDGAGRGRVWHEVIGRAQSRRISCARGAACPFLSVTGMHCCASCVGRAEAALLRQPGVLSASVNLATETAQVRYVAGATDAGSLARALDRGRLSCPPCLRTCAR